MKRLLPLLLLVACHPVNEGYAPPAGKRLAALPVAPGQAAYLEPGDRVQLVILSEGTRQDGSPEPRSETVAAEAEVLRVDKAWSKDSALVALALTPNEAHWAAIALDLERPLLLQELSGPKASLARAPSAAGAGLDAGRVGAALNVHPDQVAFLAAGRRVDVVVTRASGKGAKEDLSARTLVQDALLLGLTQAKDEDQWATVQLAVTPEQAKTLSEAAGAEDQFLLLGRSPDDHGTGPVEVVRSNSRLGRAGEAASPHL